MTGRARTRRRVRGQALPEFALVLPIIVMVLFGIFDLGRAVYAYSTIAEAARTGGRVAIVYQDQGTDCALDPGTAKCAAAHQALALAIHPEAVFVGFENSDGSQCDPVAIDCIAVVTVPYSFHTVTPLIGDIIGNGGAIPLASTTRLPVECLSEDTGSACHQVAPTPTPTP